MSQRSRRSNSVSSQKSDISERSDRRAKSPRSPRSDRKDGPSERESSENFHTECRAGFVAIVGNTKDHIKSRDQLQQALQNTGRNPTNQTLDKYWTKNTVYINFDEFCDIMRKEKATTKGDLVKAFRTIDINGDGYITHDELYRVLTQRGEKMTRDEVKRLIDDADCNKDGKLDYGEFCSMMLSTVEKCKKQSMEKLEKMEAKRRLERRPSSARSRDGSPGDHDRQSPKPASRPPSRIARDESPRDKPPSRPSSARSTPRASPKTVGKDHDSPHPSPRGQVTEISKSPVAKRKVKVPVPKNLESWNHVQRKGCFHFEEDGSIISHEYKLDLPHATNVWITVQPLYLHREDKDEPVENPVDTTLVVLRDGDRDRDSFIQFTDIRDGEKYCLRCDLRSGSYRLLPFTSGCRLRKRKSQPKQEVPLVVTKSGEIELSRPFRDTLTDIFEILDLDGNGLLSREEFNLFQVRTSGEEVDDEAWEVVEENFELKKGELTRKGFTDLNLMEAQDSEGDTEELWVTLSSMGYNKALRQDEACPFVIDIYAEECKPKMVLEGLLEDNEDVEDAMCKFISSKGESRELKGGKDVVLYTYSTDSRISTAVENKAGRKAAVQLDCSRSKNCSTHRDDLDYTAEVPPKKTTIGHHILPSNDRQEWIYRCKEAVL
ncbi:EF-hand calcium-binding domain-containing protein 7-like isoform X2 [Branchiostoma floridae x Branchiostoma belcheri]